MRSFLLILFLSGCTNTVVEIEACDPATAPCLWDIDPFHAPACCLDGPNCGVIREPDGAYSCYRGTNGSGGRAGYVEGEAVCREYGIRCRMRPAKRRKIKIDYKRTLADTIHSKDSVIRDLGQQVFRAEEALRVLRESIKSPITAHPGVPFRIEGQFQGDDPNQTLSWACNVGVHSFGNGFVNGNGPESCILAVLDQLTRTFTDIRERRERKVDP